MISSTLFNCPVCNNLISKDNCYYCGWVFDDTVTFKMTSSTFTPTTYTPCKQKGYDHTVKFLFWERSFLACELCGDKHRDTGWRLNKEFLLNCKLLAIYILLSIFVIFLIYNLTFN